MRLKVRVESTKMKTAVAFEHKRLERGQKLNALSCHVNTKCMVKRIINTWIIY